MRRRSIAAEQERRHQVRFPIPLPVRYRLAKRSGWGRILNIGSRGALFTIDQPVRLGQRIELDIGWPVLLHDNVYLSLVAAGVIVRVEEGRAAVRFGKYCFRTASSIFRRQALLPELCGDAQPYA
ncbi:MAG: PilZ domain-containing protein [Bryobacteraceae bacterium]|jgi:hypothetical protein